MIKTVIILTLMSLVAYGKQKTIDMGGIKVKVSSDDILPEVDKAQVDFCKEEKNQLLEKCEDIVKDTKEKND